MVSKGLFGEPADQKKNRGKPQSGPRLSLEAVVAFCVKHPDKINAEECDPDLLQLIEGRNVQLSGCQGTRQHLVQSRAARSAVESFVVTLTSAM